MRICPQSQFSTFRVFFYKVRVLLRMQRDNFLFLKKLVAWKIVNFGNCKSIKSQIVFMKGKQIFPALPLICLSRIFLIGQFSQNWTVSFLRQSDTPILLVQSSFSTLSFEDRAIGDCSFYIYEINTNLTVLIIQLISRPLGPREK